MSHHIYLNSFGPLQVKRVETLQLRIRATDMGEEPQRSDNEATVTITVNRNKNPPVFRDTERYQKTILETLGEGNEVFRITVQDNDRVVCVILL